jgi:hypothetical protein
MSMGLLELLGQHAERATGEALLHGSPNRQRRSCGRGALASRIAIDILGVRPDDVAHAIRGNLTQEDEDDDSSAR